jgi:flavin-dependent dehydrogenase
MKKVAVVIIGAGAAGLSCALYLKRAGVDFVLLEKGAPGGKLLTIAEIGNYPGLPQLSGAELAMDLLNSATRVGVEVGYGDVVSVSKEGNNSFSVKTSDEIYLCQGRGGGDWLIQRSNHQRRKRVSSVAAFPIARPAMARSTARKSRPFMAAAIGRWKRRPI